MFKHKNDIKNINAQVLIESFNYSTYHFVSFVQIYIFANEIILTNIMFQDTYVRFFNIKFQF